MPDYINNQNDIYSIKTLEIVVHVCHLLVVFGIGVGTVCHKRQVKVRPDLPAVCCDVIDLSLGRVLVPRAEDDTAAV